MGADGTDQQGMAIVRCTRNQPCSNASTGATPILDHDRYTVLVLKLLPEYACHQIGRTSGAKWHHYGERLPRPDLLAAGTHRRHACSGRSQQKVASPDHVPLHLTFDPPRDGQPPSFRSRFVPTLHAWSHAARPDRKHWLQDGTIGRPNASKSDRARDCGRRQAAEVSSWPPSTRFYRCVKLAGTMQRKSPVMAPQPAAPRRKRALLERFSFSVLPS